ncbi:MAG: methylated-DNA--[protein]-cysteine S-methyltransferase [bacterium]|nr:methylated-DNA--[protein]-cysteine S-methyltransferase [bacterium]
MTHRIYESPVGTYAIVVDDHGAVTGIYQADQRHHPGPELLGEPDDSAAPEAARQLDEYFAGTRTTFDLPMNPAGSEFQRAVWQKIAAIPFGGLTTYGQIAAELGSSARAVGSATGRNPISIVVPCHRVVSSSSAITGYAGGLETKEWLLRHEGYTITPARGENPKATAALVSPPK